MKYQIIIENKNGYKEFICFLNGSWFSFDSNGILKIWL